MLWLFIFSLFFSQPLYVETRTLGDHYFASNWAGSPPLYANKLKGKVRFFVKWSLKEWKPGMKGVLKVYCWDRSSECYEFLIEKKHYYKTIDIPKKFISYHVDILYEGKVIESYKHPLWNFSCSK